MITAVSLNPSIDRTLVLDSMHVGGLNRVQSATDAAAGKGVNVALAAAAIGQKAECIGLMPEKGRELFEERLGSSGIRSDFVPQNGAVRVNTKVLDSEKGEITEFNQSGVPVDVSAFEKVRELVLRHSAPGNVVILSGSLPPSCSKDTYRILASAASEYGARVIVDADGEVMKSSLNAKPFLIKPNRFELEQLAGETLSSEKELLAAACKLTDTGIGIAAISLGSEGALITDGARAFRAEPLSLKISSTVAAGDSMIAGFAAACIEGKALDEMLIWGTALAAARCITPPEKMIDRNAWEDLKKLVRIREMRMA